MDAQAAEALTSAGSPLRVHQSPSMRLLARRCQCDANGGNCRARLRGGTEGRRQRLRALGSCRTPLPTPPRRGSAGGLGGVLSVSGAHQAEVVPPPSCGYGAPGWCRPPQPRDVSGDRRRRPHRGQELSRDPIAAEGTAWVILRRLASCCWCGASGHAVLTPMRSPCGYRTGMSRRRRQSWR